MATTAELMTQGATTCVKCNGQMHVSGGEVTCGVCGLVDAAHPLTVATRAARAAPPRVQAPPASFGIEQYESGHGERLLALERLLKDQGQRLKALEERETQGGTPKPKRAGVG